MAKYNSLTHYLENLSHILHKPSIWTQLLFVIILALVIVSLLKNNNIEGFVDTDTDFEHKTGPELYDDFYADIYDILLYSYVKNHFEIGAIRNVNPLTEESRILDIGSATGHHVDMLVQEGYNAIGLDSSSAMVEKAKENYPNNEYIQGDIMNSLLFQPESFTQILCLYFTLYYVKDKALFFNNCYNWLVPGGSLIVHLVDPHMFDPIIPPSNPLLMLTPQRYAEDRITQSKVTFEDFKYISNFEYDGTNTKFIERFQDKDSGKTFRKNEHTLYMESEEEILALAQTCGFIIQGKLDMIKAGYEYQYLYILEKPE